jgi:hypothetical protein
MYESLLARLGEFDNPPPRSFPLLYLFSLSLFIKKLLLYFLPGATPDKETNRKRNRK